MDGHVLLLVLAAALLHATWNSIVKGGSNKLFESSMNALGGGLGALLILPFLPAPAPESWGLLALSCCFHLTYYICISQAYDKVDLSIGYTIMRGCAPMITALALLLLGNHISLTGWGGVLLLCLGILTLTLEHVHKGARAANILICLRTSLVIAGYTLADGYGARASGNGVSYTCWIFFLNIFPIHAYVLWRHGGTYISYLRKRAATGLFGGLCGLGSYGIALWAMTLAPIALVAAASETDNYTPFAQAMDRAAHTCGVNFIGGFSALVQKGMTEADRKLINSIPEALSTTDIVCGSVNVGSTKAGIDMDAVALMGRTIKDLAERTADKGGFGCAKLVVFCNAVEDNPFMAGAFHGVGEPERVINVGVSGPGVVHHALQQVVGQLVEIVLHLLPADGAEGGEGKVKGLLYQPVFADVRFGKLNCFNRFFPFHGWASFCSQFIRSNMPHRFFPLHTHCLCQTSPNFFATMAGRSHSR